MKKSIKKLIKKYEKLNPGCKVKYKPENFASIEIYNSGGLISVLEPFELKIKIEEETPSIADIRDEKLKKLGI